MSQAPALALAPDPDLAPISGCRPATPGQGLPRLVTRLLELCEGGLGPAQACAALQIPEAKGLAIVRKLSRLGLLEPDQPAPDRTTASGRERAETLAALPSLAAPAGSGFSAAEEAFFASEVIEPLEPDHPAGLGEKVSRVLSGLVLRLHGWAL